MDMRGPASRMTGVPQGTKQVVIAAYRESWGGDHQGRPERRYEEVSVLEKNP